MSLRDEMNAAAEEYARRIEQRQEADRTAAAPTKEARHRANADLFATALENAFTDTTQPNDTQENS